MRTDSYIWLFALLLELAGLRPRIDCDEEWAEMLRHAGWRPFMFYRSGG